jgi:hypothetical protein
MVDHPMRRDVLRAVAAGGVAGLAGCSSLPLIGGDGGGSPARDWLFDPTAFTDEVRLSIEFRAPAALDEHRDQLHPEVAEGRTAPFYTDALAAEDTDWALRITDPLLDGPVQFAYGGSFDEDAAREASTAAWTGGETVDGESIEGYETLSNDEEGHGAYRAGHAVSARPATRDEFERLVAGAESGDERLADVDDDVAEFLDELGFDHAVQGGILPGDGDYFDGSGTSYRVDGEETTLRLVRLNDDLTETQFREIGEEVDGLRDLSIDAEGPVRSLTAVADTDRVGLRGQAFKLFQLPYD